MKTLPGEKKKNPCRPGSIWLSSPEWPAVCDWLWDLGASNSTGKQLVSQNNKLILLQDCRWWPLLEVKGSTCYTCQKCDLLPPESVSRSLGFLPLLFCPPSYSTTVALVFLFQFLHLQKPELGGNKLHSLCTFYKNCTPVSLEKIHNV